MRTSGILVAVLLCASPVLARGLGRIAVLDVKPLDPALAADASLFAEVLQTELAKATPAKIISKGDVAAMLGFEKQKALLGCNEDSCLAEIGGALGAEYLVYGSVGRAGKRLRYDVKLMDARRVEVVAREGLTVDDDRTPEAAGDIAAKLAARLPGAGTAAAPGLTREADKPGSRALPWALVGAGVAGLAGAGALTAVALGFNARKPDLYYADAEQQRRTASWEAAGAGALGLAGTAAIATGVWLLLRDEPPATLSLGADGRSVLLAGTF